MNFSENQVVKFKVWFASNEPDIDKQLDDMNWIVDYGGFKPPTMGHFYLVDEVAKDSNFE